MRELTVRACVFIVLRREGLEQAMAAVVEDAKAHALSRMQER
jgi:hypothetical protein